MTSKLSDESDSVTSLLRGVPFVAAPMVQQTDLPYRLLLRRMGFKLCYTPMIHAKKFLAGDDQFRKKHFATCPEDRPLVAQFCATEPDDFVAAARLVMDCVDAVDLNLGCPQPRAQQEGFGAFLVDDSERMCSIVRAACRTLPVPVFCKIRLQESVEASVNLALCLERAGAAALTVHGRKREQRHHTGSVDWSTISAIKLAVSIPVFGNGGLRSRAEAEMCLKRSGVDAVMFGTAILSRPWLLSDPPGATQVEAAVRMAMDYISFCSVHPVPPSVIGRHLSELLVIPWFYDSTRLRQRERDALADELSVTPAEGVEVVCGLAMWHGNPALGGTGPLAVRMPQLRRKARTRLRRELKSSVPAHDAEAVVLLMQCADADRHRFGALESVFFDPPEPPAMVQLSSSAAKPGVAAHKTGCREKPELGRSHFLAALVCAVLLSVGGPFLSAYALER